MSTLITIDLDATDDPTHGAQQMSCFNGFYDHACYLPLLAFLTFDREREQHLCAAALRPDTRVKVVTAIVRVTP